MILAIVGIVHGHDLLPYYLDHYRACGVDRFFIACAASQLDPSGALEKFLCEQTDVTVIAPPDRFVRTRLVGSIEEEVRRGRATANDWVVPTDLDEFIQFPRALPDLVEDVARDGCTHVVGTLLDRISSRGELTSVAPSEHGVSIWAQYPLSARVTELITHGGTSKVVLSRGDLPWTIGHHQMLPGARLRQYPEEAVVHHFKWRSGLSQMLEWRVDNEQRVRVPWSGESERLLAYLQEHGRIRPEDVGAEDGWDPARGLH